MIHHVGYVVPDLPAAVERFSAGFGAGPFRIMENIPLEDVTFEGEPAVYDHSSAFGRWGPILVELTEVHRVEPAGLARALTAPGMGIGHVAWLADDLEAETARLQALGLEPFHTGHAGPASAVWFRGGPCFGHPVEVLRRNPELLDYYASL
jgi:catechol 2,3-dioxygenase-like lactoylglutathione lyase family enzyme